MLLLYIAGVAGLGLVIVYTFYPIFLYYAAIRLSRWLSGVTLKTVRVGDQHWAYLERGVRSTTKPSLLFIHGFSDSKDEWNLVIKYLPQDEHIIAVDLPGHGQTPPVPLEGSTSPYELYVEGIFQFVQLIGLGRSQLHLVGLSMGGAIVGLYSATYPGNVKQVTFVCPAMETPTKSAMREDAESGRSSRPLLLPQTPEDLGLTLRRALHTPIPIPKQLLKGAFEARKHLGAFYKLLWRRIGDYPDTLNKAMGKVTPPSQIIWGMDDQMVHVSGADVLKTGLPDVRRVDLIPLCGHAVNMEIPTSLAKLLMDFRSDLEA